MFEIEVPFDCPFCGAPVSVLVDPSARAQRYVEDCEGGGDAAGCRPLEIAYEADGEAVTAFSATAVEP